MIPIKEHLRTLWQAVVNYLGTMILSGLMGLIVWLIAIDQVNPLITRDYGDSIPIEARGLDPTILPVQDLSRENVRVHLRAPQKTWEEIQPQDIVAYVDLSGYEKGAHEVPIQVEATDRDIVITSLDRRMLRIQLDDLMTKTVPVRVTVLDSAEYGYSWDLPTVSPEMVTVVGPAQQVRQVAVAQAPVYLRGATTQVERLQTVTLLNRLDQATTNVRAVPAAVDIVIPVERWPGRRAVAVRVKLVGQPDYGYRLVRVTTDPSNVVLYGDATMLEQVPGFVETAPLSLDGATDDIRARLELILPEGINASEGNSVAVNAEILPLEDSRTLTLLPILRGLDPTLRAEFSPETVDVILSGPLTALNSLGSDDIYVTLDASGLLPGSYVVEPTVIGPAEIRTEGILPETVEVVVRSLLTSTLTTTGTIPSVATATPEIDVGEGESAEQGPLLTPSATSTPE